MSKGRKIENQSILMVKRIVYNVPEEFKENASL